MSQVGVTDIDLTEKEECRDLRASRSGQGHLYTSLHSTSEHQFTQYT